MSIWTAQHSYLHAQGPMETSKGEAHPCKYLSLVAMFIIHIIHLLIYSFIQYILIKHQQMCQDCYSRGKVIAISEADKVFAPRRLTF